MVLLRVVAIIFGHSTKALSSAEELPAVAREAPTLSLASVPKTARSIFLAAIVSKLERAHMICVGAF